MCTSHGGPNNTYQWQANDTDILGETLAMLTLADVDALTGGLYTCMVTMQLAMIQTPHLYSLLPISSLNLLMRKQVMDC